MPVLVLLTQGERKDTTTMWVRTKLKISHAALLRALFRSVAPPDREQQQRRVEQYFEKPDQTIACLSLRSGFDLLLQSLDLKPGDEVIFTALNVRAMVKIVTRLGLVPVPVDIDLANMTPRLDNLKRVITSRSKVFVAAHLFGSRCDFSELFAHAKSQGILAVEDCAQAFNGCNYQGSEHADVVMYSFGPIKTATALGGGLMIVREAETLAKMRALQSHYPLQSNAKQRKRIVKFIGLKVITSRPVLGLITRSFARRGLNYENALADRVRDVAPLKEASGIRQQPSAMMLWMMNDRLYGFRMKDVQERQTAGRELTRLIADVATLPGQANRHHDYWVYALLHAEPKSLIQGLRQAGFDAADLPRSQHITAPADRPELEPANAALFMSKVVVLPCYAEMPQREIDRQAEVIRGLCAPNERRWG
jgi:perosamine synthetase